MIICFSVCCLIGCPFLKDRIKFVQALLPEAPEIQHPVETKQQARQLPGNKDNSLKKG